MTETTTNDPAAFELVFVDDDETAALIGVTIEQSGGAALTTLYGQHVAWCPENLSVWEAAEWAIDEIHARTSVPVADIAPIRSADLSRGDLRYGFREISQ